MFTFPDPKKPLETCSRSVAGKRTCEGCTVQDSVACHFKASEPKTFLALWLPLFVFGGAALALCTGWRPLLAWVGMSVGFFGFLEIRVMCSHCPHYAEPSFRTIHCWANYGAPKLWKHRPWPMSFAEKALFLGGILAVAAFPPAALALHHCWGAAATFSLAFAACLAHLYLTMCNRCPNMACPANHVPEPARSAFLRLNKLKQVNDW